jgi:hypothetical protein
MDLSNSRLNSQHGHVRSAATILNYYGVAIDRHIPIVWGVTFAFSMIIEEPTWKQSRNSQEYSQKHPLC